MDKPKTITHWIEHIWKISLFDALIPCDVIYKVFPDIGQVGLRNARELQTYCAILYETLGDYPGMSGSCRKLSEHLVGLLEGAELYYNSNHSMVCYEGKLFDLWGVYDMQARNILTGTIDEWNQIEFIHEDHFGEEFFKRFHEL